MVGARVLAGKFTALAGEGEAVGVMLPNANGAAATLLGMMSAGRVPAMINFTAGVANVQAACTAAEVRTIVTSRAFVERARLDKLVEALAEKARIIYLEDLRATVSSVDKIRGLVRYRRALVPRDPDEPAAILFTSGSEGTPKGVVLSHRNMLCNAAQAAARIDFGRTDKVFNTLPVFHAFGLTVGLVLPLVSGVPVFLYPSPLHYRIVPELVYGANATILFGTDTFLSGYARAAHPYDFRSVRYVLAGAEPVKEATRRLWSEKFGLRILEGYGVTETAPALALNTPMFNRFGTVGRLLPGIEARLEPVPGVEEGGRLYVRGPNVMLGYLKSDRPGVLLPPEEGWHDTGDIVTIDRDGFVTIKGRAKRFAKIGGEMISLAAVESARIRTVARCPVGRRHRTRSAPGRTPCPGHRKKGRDARRLPSLCQEQGSFRFAGAGRGDGGRQIAGPRVGQGRSCRRSGTRHATAERGSRIAMRTIRSGHATAITSPRGGCRSNLVFGGSSPIAAHIGWMRHQPPEE